MKTEWLTTSQAADALGVSAQTVRDLCNARKLQHMRIGKRGHHRISREAIDRYIAKHTKGPDGRPRDNSKLIAHEQFLRDMRAGRI